MAKLRWRNSNKTNRSATETVMDFEAIRRTELLRGEVVDFALCVDFLLYRGLSIQRLGEIVCWRLVRAWVGWGRRPGEAESHW